MKKYLLYLVPIMINVVLSVIWVVCDFYKQDTLVNMVSILLTNILLTPTILIFINQIILQKRTHLYLPLFLSIACSLLCPFVLYIVWGFAYGFNETIQSFTTSIVEQSLTVYQLGISVGICTIYALYQILKIKYKKRK